MIPTSLATLLLIISVSFSCVRKTVTFTASERAAADSVVRSARSLDSLRLLQERLEREGDRIGSIVALREWGKRLRNESRFEEALAVHREGLRQAETLRDTIEWVQALNNIGTDYRRMGVLDAAQDYHYRASILSEECADTSFTARKNRVVSLNGLGNIYLTLGNYERADSVLRRALKGEEQLRSALGLAINYANIGAIFEKKGTADSAWVYYRRAMGFNQKAGSTLGIALCHTYFGSLYEKEGKYDMAMEEYETAYGMMENSKDDWHSLNILIALAGLHISMDDRKRTEDYLERARTKAEQIKSNDHLAEINTIYYLHHKRLGNYRTALDHHEQAVALKDSLLNMEMINRIQNTSMNIERGRQERALGDARLRLERERSIRNKGYILLTVLLGLIVTLLYVYALQRKTQRELQDLSRMRDRFITNITHEFRTPLTVILDLSNDLQEDSSGLVKDKAVTIERHGKGLLKLINQLLDFSKVKASLKEPDWQNGNITNHLMMIVETYRDYAASRNISLQFFARDSVEMDFVPDYVNKVINNLLSNAFKFTPEFGTVSLITLREGRFLLIDVSDTGEGMDDETVAHAFEPFYQADGGSRNIGTGVGLALVKQIMDALEGKITVESVLGHGSTFHLRIPINNNCKRGTSGSTALDPMLPETEMAIADNEIGEDRCKLLVIEDNRDIASYIGSLFSERYDVSYATNGREGLDKALALVPDLIITDRMMPEMDGLELCRQVRGNEVVNHIPIIVVTARVTDDERLKGIEAGADTYLAKPFNKVELRTLVEKHLDRHRRLRSKYGENPGTGTDNTAQLTDAERRFLSKTVDMIFLLMNKRTLDVGTLAENLCMSPRQFHRKILALTGDTPASYMLKVKMQRARNLLKSKPGLTIEDIADRCGFEHASSFYHAFKKLYGISPARYRKTENV